MVPDAAKRAKDRNQTHCVELFLLLLEWSYRDTANVLHFSFALGSEQARGAPLYFSRFEYGIREFLLEEAKKRQMWHYIGKNRNQARVCYTCSFATGLELDMALQAMLSWGSKETKSNVKLLIFSFFYAWVRLCYDMNSVYSRSRQSTALQRS